MDDDGDLGYYILDDMTPVRVPFSAEPGGWAQWMHEANRYVALSEIEEGLRVSTVFLGIDHGFFPGQGPLIFETMVFGPIFDCDTERYATWEDAVAGHVEVVDRIYEEVQRLRNIDRPVAEYPPQREGP